MSNSLLLRLFQSSFFNSWLAVSYLFKYPDSVGIQHYLTDQLKQFPVEEIEFFLPQLCHLLISRPTDSVALECFIVEKCEQSTHIAMLTMWYFQAYLSDLSLTPHSPAFSICKRMYNKCQMIVFADSVASPARLAHEAAKPTNPTNKVNENIPPALAGMGLLLGGIAQPGFAMKAGAVAIAQGRRQRAMSFIKGVARRKTIDGPTSSPSTPASPAPDSSSSKVLSPFEEAFGTEITLTTSSGPPTSLITTNPLSPSRPSKNFEQDMLASKNEYLRVRPPLQSSVSHPDLHKALADASSAKSRRFPSISAIEAVSPTRSRPTSLQPASRRTRSQSQNPSAESSEDEDTEEILSQFDPSVQQRLLKGNYFRSEMQFILALQDISTRLIIVPKPARLSALQAELTLLNNNLPAEVCIPMWCPAKPEHPVHHRVVRISPTDAVVLNSADRVPYLLMVEVLEGDLTFDPNKTVNKQSLSRIIREDRKSRRNKSVDSNKSRNSREVFQPPTSIVPPSKRDLPEEVDVVDSPLLESRERYFPSRSATPEPSRDQVHLLSGDAISPRGSINQRRGGSPRLSDEMLKLNLNAMQTTSPTVGDIPLTPMTPSSAEHYRRVLKRRQETDVDEFADSMRTAAVMLAQLNNASSRNLAPAQLANNSAALAGQASTGTNAASNSAANLPMGAGMPMGGGSGAGVGKTKVEVEAIRQRIMKEMMLLEERRMIKMRKEGFDAGVGGTGGEGGGGEKLEDEEKVRRQASVNREDPSAAVFREDWTQKRERIRQSSPYGHLPNWSVFSVIVKTGADLRQEQMACQLIKEMIRVWEEAKVPIWMRYMRILVTSDSSGLIETIENAISIHSLKKDAYARSLNDKGFIFTLFDYFVKTYGDPSTETFTRAQDNFMRSLAAYSIASYILQIKDRHNGNILIDTEGHCVHIDFGFMLSNSPGSMGFEAAPFKLPQEYLDILGGIDSEKFAEFKALMKTSFLALRKQAENLVLLVEMMQKDSKLPCFLSGDFTASQLRDRFHLSLTEPQVEEFIDKLIMSAACSVYTRLYDTYQYYTQGIL